MTGTTSTSGISSPKGKLIGGYRNLILWKESKALTLLVYKITKEFPDDERFGLTSQMRRASVSVMSQIAEGWVRRSKKDKLRYLEISEGSLLELESQGEIANEIGYLSRSNYLTFDNQRARVAYLLYRYKNSIESKP